MDIVAEYSSLELPIAEKPRVLKSNHRHPICRITFYPTVKPDGSTSWKDGSIVTGSKDGIINYWSLDLQLERTVQSTCPLLKVHFWFDGCQTFCPTDHPFGTPDSFDSNLEPNPE